MQTSWINDEASRNPRRVFYTVIGAIAIAASALAFINQNGTVQEPHLQIGPDPLLPAIRHYLVPPIRIATPRPWQPGETPTVPSDLQIEPFATKLARPRSVFVLPNGDVLAIESTGPAAPIKRPKDLIVSVVLGAAGEFNPAGNRITLIRPANNGAPAIRTVFLDHLESPFGVALVGHDLYVANTNAIVRYHYNEGDTHISLDPRVGDIRIGRSN
jgi:glucose/arabinose dehydrogenase